MRRKVPGSEHWNRGQIRPRFKDLFPHHDSVSHLPVQAGPPPVPWD